MIRAVVVGQEKVIANLGKVHPRVLGRLRAAVKAETFNLVRLAKEKVSGPVLKTGKTGHLRAGINPLFQETDTSITGSAGIGMEKGRYPRVHEYGGTFTVREHQRMMKTAFGRPVKVPRQVTVRSHTATYPERSYLRSSLRENVGRIRQNLEKAVAEGVKG